MKLKITGNINNLQNEIDSFRENLRSELTSKSKENIREFRVILLFSIALFMGSFVCSIFYIPFFLGFIISVLVSLLFNFVLTRIMVDTSAIKSDGGIEIEVNKTVQSFFGSRLEILKQYNEGKLLSAKVEEFKEISFPSINTPSLEICFKYIFSESIIGGCFFSPIMSKTVEKDNQGVLKLDLETGCAKYYYKDEFYDGLVLEIIEKENSDLQCLLS